MNEDELKEENAELHADYEALADENTKLRDQNARLKAEVERLRQAGDALEQEVIGCYFEQDDPADSESLRAWRAAKEGKQP